MSLETRLVRLERQHTVNPGLCQRWTDMLTRLYTAAVAYLGDHGDDQAARTMEPIDYAALRETAARYAKTGSPATISDLFRLVRAEEARDAEY